MSGSSLRAIAILGGLMAAVPACCQSAVTLPAVAQPPADEMQAEPPRDLRGRERFPAPTVRLNDLSGWTLELIGGAQGELRASRARPLWEEISARLVMASSEGMLRLVPPAPIALSDGWNTVTLWAYLWNESRRRSVAGPFSPQAFAQVADESGELHTIALPRISAAGVKRHWNLWQAPRATPDWSPSVLLGDVADIALDRDTLEGATHLHSGGDGNGRIDGSGEFVALLVQPPRRMIDPQVELFVDSLSFHRAPEARPERPGPAPVPGVLDATVTPTADGVTTEVVRDGEAFIFRSVGEDGTLEFGYEPRTGTLGDITASWNGGEAFAPMSGGGLRLAAVGEDGQPAEGCELLDCGRDGESVIARLRLSGGGVSTEVRYSLRAVGRALEVGIEESEGMAAALDFGRVEGVSEARSISVPYMVLDGRAIFRCNEPRVVLADGLFVGGMLDWHRSDGAQWLGADGSDPARLLGGSRYDPLTDGRRRPLRETVYVAVSPKIEDVLPEVPHAASPYRARFARHFYVMTGSPYPGFVEMNDRFGLERCVYNHHGSTWAAIADNHFMVARAREEIHGKLPAFSASLRERGHLFGLIMMYTGLSPMSALWDEGRLALQPSGYWQFDWFNLYAADHGWLTQVHSRQEAQIHELYGTDVYYYDTHTARDPANPVNFRVEADGAGTARSVWASSARIFAQTRERGRLSISEGRRRWLYAGLTDADYGTLEGHAPPWQREPLVDFDLLRLHRLGVTVGHLNFFGYNAGGPPEGHPSLTGEGFDQERAFAVAFGHCVMQHGVPPGDYSEMLTSYYLMMPVQRVLAASDVEQIAYFDGERFLSTSDALRADVVRDGRLRVRYAGGVEVHVHYAAEGDWTIAGYTLPPYGWVVTGSEVLAFAARVNGAPVQYARCREWIFMDTGDGVASVDGLTVRGAVVIRPGDALEVMPVGGYGKLNAGSPLWREEIEPAHFEQIAADRGCAEVAVDRATFGITEQPRVLAFGYDGAPVPFTEFEARADAVALWPGREAMVYTIASSRGAF